MPETGATSVEREGGSRSSTATVGVLVRPRPTGLVSERLRATVAGLGHTARLVAPDEGVPEGVDLLLIYGNAAWFRRPLQDLTAASPGARPRIVVWHSEPLPPSAASGLPRPRLHARELAKVALRDDRATDPYTNLRVLRRLHEHGALDRVVVTSEGAVETLAEEGIAAVAVPIGRHPDHGRDLGLARDIDVLFLGALDVPRRRRALRALRRRGVSVTAVGGWDDPRYWGEAREQLVNRARIFLNVLRRPGQFSGERLVIGMANRALVLSEPIYRPEPFVPGVHYIESSLDLWPEVIEAHLADEMSRCRMAEAGHAFVMSELTYERSVARVLEVAGA